MFNKIFMLTCFYYYMQRIVAKHEKMQKQIMAKNVAIHWGQLTGNYYAI